jgi:hypothetical protein
MNKSDIKLIIIVLIITISLGLYFKLYNNTNAKTAYVYYENNQILKIDLKKNREYKVKGYNGDVIIEVLNNKIRVKKENSPLHICSYQGYTNSSYQPIICLPNRIVIKIVDEKESKIDAIVR